MTCMISLRLSYIMAHTSVELLCNRIWENISLCVMVTKYDKLGKEGSDWQLYTTNKMHSRTVPNACPFPK